MTARPVLREAIVTVLQRNGVMSFRALMADLGRSAPNLSAALRRLARSGAVLLLDGRKQPLVMDRRRCTKYVRGTP